MAEEETILEQLQGLALRRLQRILLEVQTELGHVPDIAGEASEQPPSDRKELVAAIEAVVERRPAVQKLRQREEELRRARELERKRAEEELRRAREEREAEEKRLREQREEEERLERERRLEEERRKEEEDRRLKEAQEAEERRRRRLQEAEERVAAYFRERELARRASPSWHVCRGAYLRALDSQDREAYLSSLSTKILLQLLEDSGLQPAMPPLDKSDYVTVLSERAADRQERERRAELVRLEQERLDAEERARAEERQRREEEEATRIREEEEARRREEERNQWQLLEKASRAERESFLEAKSMEELEEMFAEAGFVTQSKPVVRDDIIAFLAKPLAEHRREEELREKARKAQEELERCLVQELVLWTTSPVWLSRRLAYIYAMDPESAAKRRSHFEARNLDELRRLAAAVGLDPSPSAPTDGDEQSQRQALLDALVEPAADRIERARKVREEAAREAREREEMRKAQEAEEEHRRLRAEEVKATQAELCAQLESWSVKELRQKLQELGIPALGAKEKRDLASLLAASPKLSGDNLSRPQIVAAPEASPLDVADRVIVHGLKQAVLNGCRGQLVSLEGERWLVRLEGFRDKLMDKLIKPANLELRQTPVKLPQGCSIHLVSGDGEQQQLCWDEHCGGFHGCVALGAEAKPEHFKLLVDGRADLCLYPDVQGACPFHEYGLRGLDGNSGDLRWAVGRHPLDRASQGSRYQVRVFLTPDGRAKHVDWVRLLVGDTATEMAPRCVAPGRPDGIAPIRLPIYNSVSICGSWTEWARQQMSWSDAKMAFVQTLPWIGQEGIELFQCALDGNMQNALYPDLSEADRILGPDGHGHDKNWEIHGAPGQFYEVRFKLCAIDGGLESVEWVRITEEEFKASRIKRGPPRLPEFRCLTIVGSWTDWRRMEEMRWDATNREYLFDVLIRSRGLEEFQITLDGSWEKTLYPYEACVDPSGDCEICGPDNDSHGKNWKIGAHPRDRGARGKKYQVRCSLSEENVVRKVDWRRL